MYGTPDAEGLENLSESLRLRPHTQSAGLEIEYSAQQSLDHIVVPSVCRSHCILAACPSSAEPMRCVSGTHIEMLFGNFASTLPLLRVHQWSLWLLFHSPWRNDSGCFVHDLVVSPFLLVHPWPPPPTRQSSQPRLLSGALS